MHSRSIRRLVLSSAVAAAAAVFVPHATDVTIAQGVPGRSVVVLSDLHMGIGKDASGAWSSYEDFRWPTEFAEFVKEVDEIGKGATDLILNGDVFELWQSSDKDCVYQDPDIGCREPEALARLNRVLAAHDAEIKALAEFAKAGSNHVVFVPGDHDAALLLPSVGQRAVQALGAAAGRVEVAKSGYWRSADGQIYAEHGHQIGLSANKFANWPAPFVNRPDGQHLARSLAERYAQPIVNRLEPTYPLVDNISQEGVGTKYAMAGDGMTDAGDAGPALLQYFLFKTDWQQFRMDLARGQTPVWELAKVRAQGPKFLVDSIMSDDPFKPMAGKALADGKLTQLMARMSDEELTTICNYRAAVRRSRRRMEIWVTQFPEEGPSAVECPRTPETVGSEFSDFWGTRDSIFARRIEEAGKGAPATAKPIVALLHAHTHMADRSQAGYERQTAGGLAPEGFSPFRNKLSPVAINGGAFQRVITPVALRALAARRDRRAATPQTIDQTINPELIRMQPDDLPACYSFIDVRPYTDAPKAVVRYWRHTEKGGWEVGNNCGGGGEG